MDAEGRANGADIVDATIETDRASGALSGRCQCRSDDVRDASKNRRPELCATRCDCDARVTIISGR